MYSNKVILVSDFVTPLGNSGDSDSGLLTPTNEALFVRAWIVQKKTGSAPTLAETFRGKCYPSATQIQFQQTGDSWLIDRAYGAVPPLPPASGSVAPRGSIVHKVTGSAGNGYSIDASVYTFTTANTTHPTPGGTVTINVVDESAFAVNDVIYHEMGCLYKVTGTSTGVLTCHDMDLAAAAISVGA